MSRKGAASAADDDDDGTLPEIEVVADEDGDVVLDTDDDSEGRSASQDGDDESGSPDDDAGEDGGGDADEDRASDDRAKLRAERRAKKGLAKENAALKKRLDDMERRQAAIESGTASAMTDFRNREIERILGEAQRQVASHDQAVEAAEQDLAAAIEAGDHQRQARAQRVLGERTANAAAAKQNFQALRQRAGEAAKQRVNPVDQKVLQQRPQADPEQTRLANDWVSKRGWYSTDKAAAAEAQALSRRLIARGVLGNSPEHWREMDRGMSVLYPEYYRGGRVDQPGKKRNGTMPSNGPSERAGSSPGLKRNADGKVLITKNHVDTWKAGGFDIVNNKDHRAIFLKAQGEHARSVKSTGGI